MQSKFVEAELDNNFINSLPDMDPETMSEFDLYLDGNIYKPIVTETERKTKEEFKPIVLDNFSSSKSINVINDPKKLGKVINLVVGIVCDLNKEENFDPILFELRLAIISVILLTGCFKTERNSNVKLIKKENIDDYYKSVAKLTSDKYKKLIKNVIDKMNIAFNVIAFSVVNFVRFNHHFPNDKRHIVRKALAGMGEDIVKKYTSDAYVDAFYNTIVTATKIVNDDTFFRTYINVIPREGDEYVCFKKMGSIHLELNDEILKIRYNPTPNGFLICDIIHQIIDDIMNKKLICLLPNFSLFKRILEIRSVIKKNPFAFHPSRLHYKYQAFSKEYEEIRKEFLGIMEIIGSFVFVYSERMYASIANAKCRNKYEDKIRKEDEDMVKIIFSVYSKQYEVKEETIDKIREKIDVLDLTKLNMDDFAEKNALRESEIKELLQ